MAPRKATKSPAGKAASPPARKRTAASTRNGNYLPEVDEYIASTAPFAQPILTHIRELIHKSLPEVEESIKWSMPFFTHRGLMLGNIAGFKQHCSFGLWGKEAACSRPSRRRPL